MRVLFIVNNKKDEDYSISNQIIEYLTFKGIEVCYEDLYLANKYNACLVNDNDLSVCVDFAIILGGDGTVLDYASRYAKYGFPYIGINIGRVGALTLLELDNYKYYIDEIVSGNYFVKEQLGLDGLIKYKKENREEEFTSYNDIVLHRGLSLKLLPLVIGVNDYKKDLFYADGVIISTPIGSSAYNASAGGPLLSYGSKSYVLTPICPQSKCFVPLVVNDNDLVCLSINSKQNVFDKEIIISVDGCFKYFVSPFDEMIIKKSAKSLKMIMFKEKNSSYTSIYKAVASISKEGEM